MNDIAPSLGVVLAGTMLAVALGIGLLRRAKWGIRFADQPNSRSLHAVARLRIGGLVMVPVFLACASWLDPARLVTLVLPCMLVFGVSLADDLRGRPIAVRLAVHLAAAMLAVGVPTPAGMLAVLAIVWSCNLFNFMDGADGLAGGMAAIGFSALGLVAVMAGHHILAGLCFALASAALGFLAWNFPPARIFMGDAGSVPLGFLAGALSWQGAAEGAWPLAVPLLLFSPFWVDASVTLLRRAARGERFWEAHRAHYYQRLVLAGWSHRRLAYAAYCLMFACAIAAIAFPLASTQVQGAIMLWWALGVAALAILIDRRCARAR